MLEQNVNTLNTETSSINPAVAAPVAPAPAVTQPTGLAIQGGFPVSQFAKLKGAFNLLGIDLPANACTSCTIDNGNIKFGENLVHNAGDFLVLRPVNFQSYWKINLGLAGSVSSEERKLCVNCYDGQTVVVEEVEYTKDEYLNKIKEQGYHKAKWEERGILHGQYISSDNDAKVGESVEQDAIFAVYMSPSALREWNAFLVKSSLSQSSGDIRLGKIEKSYNGNKWTHFTFTTVPAVDRA